MFLTSSISPAPFFPPPYLCTLAVRGFWSRSGLDNVPTPCIDQSVVIEEMLGAPYGVGVDGSVGVHFLSQKRKGKLISGYLIGTGNLYSCKLYRWEKESKCISAPFNLLWELQVKVFKSIWLHESRIKYKE